MEEDKTGLKILITQRRHRPSYTRVISQEFSQKTEIVGKSRRRRKSQQNACKSLSDLSDSFSSSNSDTNDIYQEFRKPSDECSTLSENDQSDESEYFSAEENLVAVHDVNQDNNATLLSNTCSSKKDEDVETVLQEVHVYENDFSFFTTEDKNRNGIYKRAPSKKQKRKRRQFQCNSSVFKELPFYDSDILEDPVTIYVHKEIPSLYSLCVKLLSRNKKLRRHCMIPVSFRKDINKEAEIHNEKVTWLNSILSKYEEELKLDMHTGVYELSVLVRNVWNIDPHSHIPGRYVRPLLGDRKISCLPVTQLYSFYSSRSYFSNKLMLVLGSFLHLTLPLPDPHKGNPKLKARDGSAPYDRAVDNVVTTLKTRYPIVMGAFYDKVLPYIFWARGDIVRAREGFHHLIHTNKKSRYKALYLYEIGRMLHFFDDPALLSFDSMADISEVFASKPYYCQNEVAQQVSKQISLLKANLCDQGVMTFEKARMAADKWIHCVHALPAWGKDSLEYIFYMDSLLCYHSNSRFEMGVDWLEDAKVRLKPLCGVYPELYVFVSMLYAIQKNRKRVQATYQLFRQQETIFTCEKYKECPWEALTEAVERSPSVKPLKVLWRTQLNPPRFFSLKSEDNHWNFDWTYSFKSEPTEADISCRDLNLHLTPEGHLTGDLQMSLPPLQSVLLNPYTGAIHLPVSQTTMTLRSIPSVYCNYINNQRHLFSPPVLIPMEIYRGQNGCVVQMIMPGNFDQRPAKPVFKLYWQGPNGERARVNLACILRDFVYQRARDTVKGLNTEEPVKRCMLEVLRLCYVQGCRIPQSDITSPLFTSAKAAHNKTQKLRGRFNKWDKGTELNAEKIFQEEFKYYASLELVKPPLVFGEDIFFRCKVSYEDNHELFVVIHTQSRREFKNPSISEKHIGPDAVQCTSGISKSAEGVCFILYNKDRLQLVVFNRRLHKTDTVDLSILQSHEEIVPIIIKNSVFAISASQCLYRTSNRVETFAEHLDLIHRLAFLGDMLVMVTVTGYLLFVECVSLLPIKTIVHPQAFALMLENQYIYEVCSCLKVLGEKSFQDASNQEFVRAAIAMDNKLIIIKTQSNTTYGVDIEDISPVIVTSAVTLSGQPKDICFLSESAGYLVSASIFNDKQRPYRENLYHFDHGGQLLGILLSLGQGPRSMFPVYLPGDSDLASRTGQLGKKGWHVYMRDGHDGIICVYLGDVICRYME
ncbi:uncharacterized protein LOC133174252 [Saccostrea echinata]|uniref:uncharacterized protein LOC133174252 n=1 Tax=Saccostrea echinata TaxID=191078 RepID=UPI002A80C58E|nr:uncharacterized protein LOC133174252 [Saccostrea echinata]